MLNKDFKEFVGLLNSTGVEYPLVGGYALAVHGRPRYTGDLDIWVDPDPANVQLLLRALDLFGFGSLGLIDDDFLRPDAVVQSDKHQGSSPAAAGQLDNLAPQLCSVCRGWGSLGGTCGELDVTGSTTCRIIVSLRYSQACGSRTEYSLPETRGWRQSQATQERHPRPASVL